LRLNNIIMSKREIATLAVRLLAIHFFLIALSKFEEFLRVATQVMAAMREAGATFGALTIGNNGLNTATAPATPTVTWSLNTQLGTINQTTVWIFAANHLVIVTLWFLFVFFVWAYAPRLASVMVTEFAGDPPVNTGDVDLRRLAFSLMGAYILVQSFPTFVGQMVTGFLNTFSWTSYRPSFFYTPFSWDTVIRIALGFWMLLGTHDILSRWGRFQRWATQKK
jgi:hypothetical protein